MYAVQAGQLETFLRQQLEREDIRVTLVARPEAFPQIKAVRTSEERWRYLCERNPLVLEVLRRAKGQILPKEIETPVPEEEEKGT